MNDIRISIGVPSGGSVLDEHFLSYMFMGIYEASKGVGDPKDVTKRNNLGCIHHSKGCYVGMNRSNLVNKFLNEPENSRGSHLLMVDTDISFEMNLLELIAVHLLNFPEANIISGRVNLANGYPVFYNWEHGALVHQIQPFYGIKKFDTVGTGIIVISRFAAQNLVNSFGFSIFNHIYQKPTQHSPEMEHGDDISFCKRASQLGFSLFGSWAITGIHHKTQPCPQNYPEKIIDLSPMFQRVMIVPKTGDDNAKDDSKV